MEKATLPNDSTVTVSGAQVGQFGAVTFTKAGEYHFIITEQDNGHEGYEYDERSWTATVIVKDDNSQLVVESVSYEQEDTGKTAADKATFTNKFSMSTTFAPKVKKDFTTDHVRPEAGQKTFQFNLESCEEYDENIVKMPKNTAVEIKDAGEKAFGKITFTKEGEYSFWITESEKATADQDGYTYDTTRWKVTVPVVQETKEENGVTNDVLKVDMDAVTYEAFAGNEATGEASAGEATFRNTYIPASVRFEPKVSKVISDESDLVPEGQEKEFEFSLTKDSGNPEGGAQLPGGKDEVRVTNKAGAAPASFGEIEFTKAGTYNFIIKEVDTQQPGYEYDKAEWTLTVTVEDKGGKLEIVDSYYSKNGKREEKATFINTYKVTETDYQPKVTKLIGGDNKDTATTAEFKFDLAFNGDLENLEFANDVVNQKDGAVLPDPATAAVTVDGANQSATGQFGNITFKKAGSYSFVVTEQTHEYPHYTYDNARWIVNVEVVDNASQLEVTKITYIKDGDIKEVIDVIEGIDKETSVIEFTNDYKPDAVTYIPQVEKTIAGGDGINETAFHFTLAEKEAGQAGVTMPDETGLKAEVTGEGTAAFGAITFDISGTYQFVVKEEAGTHPLYKYDDSEWILTVVVEDMDGELKVASAEYVSGEEGADEKAATFKNTYTGGALTVSKKVTGNLGEKDRNFTFTVKLEVPEGAKLAESYQCIGDAIKGVKAPTSGVLKPNDKGELVFTLRHGQSITITGLAADTKYTVTESDNSGYEVKKTGDTGKIKSNETKLAEFVNYRGKPVSGIATGDSANMFRWFLIMLAALATICVSVILRRRRS